MPSRRSRGITVRDTHPAGVSDGLWLPNLLWQARHGWPQLELVGKIAEEEAAGNRAELLPLQLFLIGPLLAPLWLGGLWWLLRRPEARRYRPLGDDRRGMVEALATTALAQPVIGLRDARVRLAARRSWSGSDRASRVQ